MTISDPPPDPRDRESLGTIAAFFDRVDKDEDLLSAPPAELVDLRREVLDALHHLLVRGRPFLRETRGLSWPLDEFRRLAPGFRDRAAPRNSPGPRDQALRFLARLPFPDQWTWLKQAERELAGDPELAALREKEERKIRRKIEKKQQKRFKLRHFLQVLKAPRLPEEKGVLRIFSLYYMFTDPGLLDEIGREYVVYVEPSMGMLFRHTWLRAFSTLPDPCLFGVAGVEDAAFLGSQDGIRTTPLAHGDYLDEDEGGPDDVPKSIDLAFNGTFDDTERKRHHLLLSLMRRPPLEGTTALVLGRGEPGNVERFAADVRAAGLADRVTVKANLKRSEVYGILPQCRLGVHLSLNENVCRAIYEFHRADIPCIASDAMAGMNPAIFTPETGLLVRDPDLPDAIAEALADPGRFSPRRWFLAHSGSRRSSRKLNGILKGLFLDLGYAWETDIVDLGSSGASRYVDPGDYERFHPQFTALAKIFAGRPRLPVSPAVD